MSSSIFASVLYLIGFLSLYILLFLWKKSDERLSGVTWLVATLLAEMCWGAFAAGILNIIRIPINLYSVGILYLLCALLIGAKLYYDGEIQSYRWSIQDIVVALAIFGAVTALVLYRVGPELRPAFANSDAAVHLKNAVSLVQSQRLPVMYFAPFQTAMLLEVIMPFVAIYHFYKIFIFFDAFLLALELLFFYLFCKESFEEGRAMKAIGILMCVFYALGYPLVSYWYTFYYWALGVMLIGFCAWLLRLYARNEAGRGYLLFTLMLACNAVTMCYMLFAPIAFIAAFLCLALIQRRGGPLLVRENVMLALKVFLLPTILAIYYCYFEFLRKEHMAATDVMVLEGGIYRDFYVNFLLLMPIVAYWIIRSLKKGCFDVNMVYFLTFLISMGALFVLSYKGYLSGYYYFKFYYPLWFFAFVLAIQGIRELLEEHWEMLAACGLVVFFLVVMHFGGVEKKIVNHPAQYQVEEYAGSFFRIYDFVHAYLQNKICPMKEGHMQICQYVVDHLEHDEDIPLLATIENYDRCFWYEAMTGEDASDYYGWQHDFSELQQKLENQEVEYFAIFKESPIFQDHRKYFKQFEKVYSNKNGVIYRTVRRE